ncbi:hypothetical protein B566_EDAN007051 [Ephemera danica]|nr:hypothetical protein B566_EDAN007051 [Ephemera danica]
MPIVPWLLPVHATSTSPSYPASDGRCMVFGGHFRTFDDRHLSFHGECKYQLALDCSANHTFAVRMSSGPRSKLITVKLGRHKVTMGQRMKTKVDGVRVTVPHRLHKILEISMQRDNLLLTTSIVSVPPSMKSQLCGLCGNYNGKAGDDMVNRQGESLHRAEEFAQAWRIGGAKSCPRGSDRGSSIPETCKTDAKKKNRDYRKCSPIRSELLRPCNSVVSAARYYKRYIKT